MPWLIFSENWYGCQAKWNPHSAVVGVSFEYSIVKRNWFVFFSTCVIKNFQSPSCSINKPFTIFSYWLITIFFIFLYIIVVLFMLTIILFSIYNIYFTVLVLYFKILILIDDLLILFFQIFYITFFLTIILFTLLIYYF